MSKPFAHRSISVVWFALALLLCATTSSGQADCPEGNLILDARVTGERVSGDPALITDGAHFAEGVPWDAPIAAILAGTDASLIVDPGREIELRALMIQADQNDAYRIEGSSDGWTWTQLWLAPPVTGGSGLRMRTVQLQAPTRTRYLRVKASGGDGRYSVSELRAFCQVPRRTDPRRTNPRDATDRPFLTLNSLAWIKAVTALFGLALFLWGFVLHRAGVGAFDRRRRDAALILLGLFSLALWFNLGRFNLLGFVRHFEFYHYHISAKYFDELGYTRLYECTTIADAEDDVPGVRERRVRNLHTNKIGGTAEILADPSVCKSHFAPPRWEEFKKDIRWYRSNTPRHVWESTQWVHGANASPVWQMIAGPLTSLAETTTGFILALALLDILLLAAMWTVVGWAFDWRAACLAALWWGTNHIAIFDWVGGAYLRQDWLALAIAGICLVRRERPLAGGFLLTWATLIRVLPGFIVAALVIKAGLTLLKNRTWRPDPSHLRFGAGCIIALALLVPASMLATGGVGPWKEFVTNSATYLKTQGTNTVGLKNVLSYDPAHRLEVARDPALAEPDAEWAAKRDEAYERRGWIKWIVQLTFLILLARVVLREPDWVALTLGIALIPIASAPASYYLAVFLGIGLLWERLGYRIGIALTGLALFTQLIYLVWPVNIESDERFAWISLGMALFSLALVALPWPTAEPKAVPEPKRGES